MYAFYKTQGTSLRPWRSDLRLAAETAGDSLFIYLRADSPWQGRLYFDPPRYHEYLGMPLDFPRINAFPQWYAVLPGRPYWVEGLSGEGFTADGKRLAEGLEVKLGAGETVVAKVYSVFAN